MHLSKQDKESIYESVMQEIYNTFVNKLNEDADNAQQQKRLSKGFSKDFLGHKDIIAMVYVNSKENNASVFIFQQIDDNEYDVYHFLINLETKLLKIYAKNVKDIDKEEISKVLAGCLKLNTKIEVDIRDIYVQKDDIESIFKVLSDDPRKVIKALCEIINVDYSQKNNKSDNKQSEDSDKKEEKPVSQKDDVKKSGFERNKEGKLTGAGAKDAQQISEMLKAIAKDDKSFAEIVRLFTAIKNLTEKSGGDYAKALAAINARLYKKQEK